MKIHFGHRVGKYDPLVRNYPVTFVPGLACCSLALCLYYYFLTATRLADLLLISRWRIHIFLWLLCFLIALSTLDYAALTSLWLLPRLDRWGHSFLTVLMR